jgi:hypothetical protein
MCLYFQAEKSLNYFFHVLKELNPFTPSLAQVKAIKLPHYLPPSEVSERILIACYYSCSFFTKSYYSFTLQMGFHFMLYYHRYISKIVLLVPILLKTFIDTQFHCNQEAYVGTFSGRVGS